MSRRLVTAVLAAALLAGVQSAHGHKQTERYIPLGQSPGASGITTWIGVIEATDAEARVITLAVGERRINIALDERTRIWLDRSRLKKTALAGDYGDLRPGRRVEVKHGEGARARVAQWIKIEISVPSGLQSN